MRITRIFGLVPSSPDASNTPAGGWPWALRNQLRKTTRARAPNKIGLPVDLQVGSSAEFDFIILLRWMPRGVETIGRLKSLGESYSRLAFGAIIPRD